MTQKQTAEIYTKSQVDAMFKDLTDQVNKAMDSIYEGIKEQTGGVNIALSSLHENAISMARNQGQMIDVVKAAMQPIASGDDAQNLLAIASKTMLTASRLDLLTDRMNAIERKSRAQRTVQRTVREVK